MKKIILAATLLVAFAVPASAAHYVMYNKSTGTCSISKSAPTTSERFSMMGIYGSAFMARRAMAGMMHCRH
jgi:hypothetical protein